jgi:hypothetical protein
MRLQSFTNRKKAPPVTMGDKYGTWEVVGLALPMVEVRCQCEAERWVRVEVLRHHNAQCRPCAAKARKVNPKLANATPSHVWQTIQSLSQLQMQYAAKLIRSRQKIQEEDSRPITKADVTDAVEMARSLSPAQLEVELKNLQHTFHAETRQSYQQYHSPKGSQL